MPPVAKMNDTDLELTYKQALKQGVTCSLMLNTIWEQTEQMHMHNIDDNNYTKNAPNGFHQISRQRR